MNISFYFVFLFFRSSWITGCSIVIPVYLLGHSGLVSNRGASRRTTSVSAHARICIRVSIFFLRFSLSTVCICHRSHMREVHWRPPFFFLSSCYFHPLPMYFYEIIVLDDNTTGWATHNDSTYSVHRHTHRWTGTRMRVWEKEQERKKERERERERDVLARGCCYWRYAGGEMVWG